MTFIGDALQIDVAAIGGVGQHEIDQVDRRRARAATGMIRAMQRERIREDQRERDRKMAAGLESWTFAILDPQSKKWSAGVNLNVGPRRFRRMVSLPVFNTDVEAMSAAGTWRTRLENR